MASREFGLDTCGYYVSEAVKVRDIIRLIDAAERRAGLYEPLS